jgi:hypothetical protein
MSALIGTGTVGATNLTASLTDFLSATAAPSGAPVSSLRAAAAAAAAAASATASGVLARPVSGRRAGSMPKESTTTTTVVAAAALAAAKTAGNASASGADVTSPVQAVGGALRASRRQRFSLDESVDSLAHFQHTHQGRFPPQPSPMATTAVVLGSTVPVVAATAPLSVTAAATTASSVTSMATTDIPDPVASGVMGTRSGFLSPSVPLVTMTVPLHTVTPMPFIVPTLPRGRQLILSIRSTWGDSHYVGLAGVDLFDGNGALLVFDDPDGAVEVIRGAKDVNDLPGYGHDPRVVSNLVDGVNATCDDLHVWLAPFTPGQAHVVSIALPPNTTLSMIRVWNYNKSRTDSARGVREVQMYLRDGDLQHDHFDPSELIFTGEIAAAPGSFQDAAEHAEVIVFTTDQALLQTLSDALDKVDAENARAVARLVRQQQRGALRLCDDDEDDSGLSSSGRLTEGDEEDDNDSDDIDDSDDGEFQHSLQMDRPRTCESAAPVAPSSAIATARTLTLPAVRL